MKNLRQYSLAVESASAFSAERAAVNYLFVDVTVNQFLNISSLSKEFTISFNNISEKQINTQTCNPDISILDNFKYLSRVIDGFDSIQVFYDGSLSAFANILPVVIISRFFGKQVNLFYYPGEEIEKIKWYHFKIFKLFNRVFVGSRYLQRLLSKKGINAGVQLPFIETSTIQVRKIDEVQPHILLVHDNPDDSGAVCAMRAFKFVKQKYPRTEMTVVTNNMIPWQLSLSFIEQIYNGVHYIESNDLDEVNNAYANTDVFINCNLSETMPIPLLSAMISGMPSISYETYGPREIIENNVNGVLIRHNDSNQLADRIIELVEVPEMAGKLSGQAVKIKDRVTADKLVSLIA